MEAFISECRTHLARVGRAHFFNVDETHWKFGNTPRLVLHRRGVHDIVAVGAKKQSGFTAILGVSASGHRFKPMIVVKGKTDRCIAKLQRKYGVRVSLKKSASCWSNSEIMDSINHVIAPATNNRPSVLMLDEFAGHKTEDVKAAAAAHNIHIIWIPPRATPTRQPLDIVTFGALKSHAVQLWRDERERDPLAKISKEIAVEHLLSSWSYLQPDSITSGFLRALDIDRWPTRSANAPSATSDDTKGSDNDGESKSSTSSASAALPQLSSQRAPRRLFPRSDIINDEDDDWRVFTFVGDDSVKAYPQYHGLARRL